MGSCCSRVIYPAESEGLSMTTNSTAWKPRLTKTMARKMYEEDGTIPKNSSDELLEFRTYLDDPQLIGRFGQFCKRRNCLPVLMCWADIMEFKAISEKTKDYQLSKANHIYHKYVKENAVVQLTLPILSRNYSEEVNMELKRVTKEEKALSSHFYDALVQECLFNMLEEAYLPYKGTLMFRVSVREVSQSYNQVSPDDFEFMEELGRGAFGFVVHCRKRSTNQHYAMKIQTKIGLLDCFSDSPKRVVFEKEALAVCHHPFIVSMDYAFQTKSFVLMAMDLCTGTLHLCSVPCASQVV